MRLSQKSRTLAIAGSRLRARRTSEGVIEIWGNDAIELQRGLGYFHAHDRLVQMILVRLVGQGRLCECLKDDDESLAIDIFMRQMGFAKTAREEVGRLTPHALAFAQAYAEGVNESLRRHWRPFEFALVGYRPEPWEPADTLLTINLMSYVGLAQTQQDIEKFLIQAIQQGANVERLKKLFAPHLDGLTDELVDLISRVRIVDAIVPPLTAAVPSFQCSNNWAVGPARSASGNALECHDPHLECNRLPAVWYEVLLHMPGNYHVGASMPGVPGVVMGRSRDVSAGFTYGFMDMVDYFIEECRDGRCRREQGWQPLRRRLETIFRKAHAPVEIVVHETERGTLECDRAQQVPDDGLYLCRAYSGEHSGAARSLSALAEIGAAETVAGARRILREVSISGNWVIADRQGNIGYQQSGLLPKRKTSGLYPVPAWWSDHAWQGLVPAGELASTENPPEAFIVTANNLCNQADRPMAINLCQGSYRAERIAELIAAKPRLSPADMQQMQTDLLSPQARRFMSVLRPLLPDTATGKLLADWDLRYDTRSRGATLFEALYRALLREVFGRGLFGLATWEAFVSSTNLVGVYFQVFDEALLGTDEIWFGGQHRCELFRRVAEQSLAMPVESVEPWGHERKVMMHNLFFGGKLPPLIGRLAGADYGPIELAGGRATIVQGQIFLTHGRLTSFAPSYRSVTDLGVDQVHTVLAGGPSGRMLSGLYTTDIKRWLNFEYKTLNCAGEE